MIEAMISMAVLAFVLLMFLSVVWNADTLRTSSRESAIAMSDVQSAIEYTFGCTFDKFKQNFPSGISLSGQLAADGFTTLPNFKDGPTNRRLLKNETMVVTWQTQDPNPTIDWVEYKLEATWTDQRGRTTRQAVVTRRSR